MKKFILLAGLAAMMAAAPAFAATEFFAAQDAATKKCSVVEKKPDGTKMVMIGKTSFKTKAEAEAAIKADKDCK
jgi:hypothetical protein